MKHRYQHFQEHVVQRTSRKLSKLWRVLWAFPVPVSEWPSLDGIWGSGRSLWNNLKKINRSILLESQKSGKKVFAGSYLKLKIRSAFCKSKMVFHQTPQTVSSACVRQLDTSNVQRSHEKEALQLAGCENRWWGGGGEREGLFHRHPVKGKRGGWGGITAGVRKRQRFRVVGQRVQEVRETVASSAAGRANHHSLQPPSRCLFVFTDQFQ